LSCIFVFVFYIVFYVYNEGSKEFFVSSCRQRHIMSGKDVSTGASCGDAQVAVENEVVMGGLREVERNL
jgi:hypothetical protein